MAHRIQSHGARVTADPQSRRAECLWCARVTAHLPGPVTSVGDGSVQVQWWSCTECAEGHTLL